MVSRTSTSSYTSTRSILTLGYLIRLNISFFNIKIEAKGVYPHKKYEIFGYIAIILILDTIAIIRPYISYPLRLKIQ